MNIEVVGADPIGSVYYQYHQDQTMPEPHTYFVEGIGEDMLCPTVDFSVIDDTKSSVTRIWVERFESAGRTDDGIGSCEFASHINSGAKDAIVSCDRSVWYFIRIFPGRCHYEP